MMNKNGFMRRLTGASQNKLMLVAALLLMGQSHRASAERSIGSAVVRTIRGSAICQEGAHEKVALRVGQKLQPGAVIVTPADSQVDLHLRENGSLVRLHPHTVLALETLFLERLDGRTIIETRLKVKSGRISYRIGTLDPDSKYTIVYPSGKVKSVTPH